MDLINVLIPLFMRSLLAIPRQFILV